MELNLFLFILLLHLSQLSFAFITSSTKPRCNEHDRVALLHFKHSFSLDQPNCPNPNLFSWILYNETDRTPGCCSWEGVTCKASSGRVIGLDLSYACLRGAIDSANPIFQISQLQKLNLSGNDFTQSQIPSAFGKFSMLKSLNLSQASFSGSIPQGILELSSLTSLDLSGNPSLHLPRHGLSSIAHNMKDLTELNLRHVNISSVVPATFANLTCLRMMNLENCGLQGHFPDEIFLLPKLESLNLMNNSDLYGHLPEFPIEITSLRSLKLSYTNFHGKLPRSIGNLISLQNLCARNCNFSGRIPSTIGNLVSLTTLSLSGNQFSSSIPSSLENLTSLQHLGLQYNPFNPGRFSWIRKLTELKGLYLASTNLYGSLPPTLSNLEQIEHLHLSYNYLSGQIPSWLRNLTQLRHLGLFYNNLEGQIPSSIFSLKSLKHLNLGLNHLSGTVDISMFREQKSISFLELSFNNLSVVSNNLNFSLPNLESLVLDYCNLREFPPFLKNQDKLKILSLEGNNISGEIPSWFLNVSTKTMVYLKLSHNFLTRFEQPFVVLPWSKLEFLNLNYNNIHGSLPLPSPSISAYILSNNFLDDLSTTICKANNLSLLDLSNNELGGPIPECLGNMSGSLQILNLKGNKFEGMIPQIHADKCSLRWINLSQNRLKGKLPRSLANCRDLESLDVGNNQITDTFPSWLGTLPKLQVLILKINNFHGQMGSPSSMADFPKLHIIDLSSNSLTGALPSEYFPFWKPMRITPEKQLTYFDFNLSWVLVVSDIKWTIHYSMSIDIMNKGMDRDYERLSNKMVYISLSENKFVGEIPEFVGDLVGLNGLDLSNNSLTGSIPSSLGELKQLESLDLSLNMLTGEIPQHLCQLTFLEYLNVSYNNLSGKIPEGGQLSTFGNTSFEGNPGIYVLPFSNRHGGANEPSTGHEGWNLGSSDHTKLVLGFEGFATGLTFGLGIGYIITTRNHQWFVKTSRKLLRYKKK